MLSSYHIQRVGEKTYNASEGADSDNYISCNFLEKSTALLIIEFFQVQTKMMSCP